ncbi:MAG: serine hydrolase [Armatimonadetes bacterium]|nr:serine hydrolase [Armatimonadota bacterium]
MIEEAASSFPGRAGIAFYDLDLGQGVYVGAEEPFEAASLIKLPILVEFYQQVVGGTLKADEEIAFLEEYRVEGSGVIKKQPAGTRYKLSELASLMITHSDNVATDMLTDRLGIENINKHMEGLGLTQTVLGRHIYDFAEIERGNDNLASARDIAVLLQGIAEGELPGSTPMHQILEAQTRKDMIPAQLPPGTRIAHKTGELIGVLHDAGIVYTPRGAYVLVLMGQDFSAPDVAIQHWADLSGRIYREFVAVRG